MTHPLSGNLSLVPLAELLEKVRREAETGILSFVTAVAPATVWIREGEAVDAAMGPREGVQVFEVLALLEEATFSFQPTQVVAISRLPFTPAQLVSHCRRYVLDTSRWVATLPALTETVTVPERGVSATNSDEQAVLRALRPGMSYLSLLLETPINPTAILEFLGRWGRQQIAPTSSAPPPSSIPGSYGPLGPASRRYSPPNGWAAARRPQPITEVEAALRKHRTPPPTALPESPWIQHAQSLAGRGEEGVIQSRPPGGSTLLAFPSVDGPSVEAAAPLSGAQAEVGPASRGAARSEREPLSVMPSSSPYLPGTTVFLPVSTELGSAPQSAIPALVGVDFEGVPLLASGTRFSVRLTTAANLGLSEARGTHGLLVQKTPHADNPQARAALENEAFHLGQYTHRNIVVLERFVPDGDAPVLVTRYSFGVSLAELLETHRVLPTSIALGIMTQVLRALECLHDPERDSGGVAHCNVSPKNILVDTHGIVRLVGFSSARALMRGKVSGSAAYESGYASPELERSQPVDARTDLYSVGVVLGRCLGLKTRKSVAPESVEALVLRAQAAQVTDRPETATELLAELTQLSALGVNEHSLASWVRFSTELVGRGALRRRSSHGRERPSRQIGFFRVAFVLAAFGFAGWAVYHALLP